ncbi:MAG: PhoX family phosphatase [Planctomycetota bacterium]
MQHLPHTDERIHNPRARSEAHSFDRLLEARISRRGLLGGMGLGAGALLTREWSQATARAVAHPPEAVFGFEPITFGITPSDKWAKGYRAQVLLRHGDALFADSPAYAPASTDARAQERQFGTNNDFIAYMPLPLGSAESKHGLLCVNHEYCNTHLLWPQMGKGLLAYRESREKVTRAQIDVEMAAHGHSVVEIRRAADGTWSPVLDSRFNRRITANTPMRISGPAAGHRKLRTSEDQDGTRVLGTFNNCAGGITPWGTVLFAEENFHKYFSGDTARLDDPAAYERYGVADDPEFAWGRLGKDGEAPRGHRRFCVEAEPHECNRFGWMVEYDPYDPECTPHKRTALGRFKHEGADVVVDRSGHVVVYMGDDERFEYLYRFVTSGRIGTDRAANMALLDEGTLYVAHLHESGALTWLPLVFGQAPLDAAHGFSDQGDVLIQARRAADLLGATPMDRPEEVQADPATGRVYAMLTNNTLRTERNVDGANPRPRNANGHVLEILPPGRDGMRDHRAERYHWNIAFLCGEDLERAKETRANLTGDARAKDLRCPDNCAFDSQSRLWIGTDGNPYAAKGKPEEIPPDGLWAVAVDGHGNRSTHFFYGCPAGAEFTGPCFTPDGETLFLSVQHPGEDSSFDEPSTRWPALRQSDDTDAQSPLVLDPNCKNHPPRSAVVAVTRIRPADAPSAFDLRIGS